MIVIILALVIAIGILGICLKAIIEYREKFKEYTSKLEWYKYNHLYKAGYAAGFGNYHIASFNAGKQWVNIKSEEDGTVILGEADPALIEHLTNLQELTEYVRKYGPLFTSSQRSAMDVAMLEKAGFVTDKFIQTTKNDPTVPTKP